MIIVDNMLKNRERKQNPIKAGIIGTGVMGTGVINQLNKYNRGIITPVIFNRSREKAANALKKAGITDYFYTSSITELNRNIANEVISLVDDIGLMINCRGLDLLIELTGTIDFAASTILRAFRHGKNVLSFNAELESTLGYYLKQKAEENGVKYGLADGDQPAATLNLYRFVKNMGLTPLVCGNIKGLQDKSRTPATQAGFARQWEMTPEMVTSFADGTKISFEQACIANATGMTIARRGMLGFNAEGHVDELMDLFDLKMLEEKGGIVDYIVGAKPGPGVFIYAKAPDDPIISKYLKYMKMGEGPLYCFYVPYHLLFLEIANSVCRMVDFDDTILSATHGIKVEVITMAKTPLKKGDVIDGLGGFKTYGLCEEFHVARQQNLLPVGIAEGSVLTNDIPEDQPVTFNDVKLPDDKISVDLYFKQLKLLNQYAF